MADARLDDCNRLRGEQVYGSSRSTDRSPVMSGNGFERGRFAKRWAPRRKSADRVQGPG
jgi:hypothetical protein